MAPKAGVERALARRIHLLPRRRRSVNPSNGPARLRPAPWLVVPLERLVCPSADQRCHCSLGFALVPLCDVMCKAFGIKQAGTAGQYERRADGRSPRRQRDAVPVDGQCHRPSCQEFHSLEGLTVVVNRGRSTGALNGWTSPSDKPMTAQAVPTFPRPKRRFPQDQCFASQRTVLQPVIA